SLTFQQPVYRSFDNGLSVMPAPVMPQTDVDDRCLLHLAGLVEYVFDCFGDPIRAGQWLVLRRGVNKDDVCLVRDTDMHVGWRPTSTIAGSDTRYVRAMGTVRCLMAH